MDNPWMRLPKKPPYVLPADAFALKKFNDRVPDNYALHIDTKLPEPFLGDPTAPVVLLNLNPRFAVGDQLYLEDPYAQALQLGNLRHAPAAYPFYHLDPRMKHFGGATWWEPRLRELIRLVGVETVANRVFCVEFFPYSSEEYRDMRSILDCQRYGFHLVDQAIDRHALIVLMRSRKEWCEQVLRLATYDRLHACSSPRKPYINSRQLPVAFPEIERVLRE